MSEYQYYEFMAVDSPLDEQQLQEVRALSTRAHITPRSFVNTYQWGDFRGDPSRLMETHFDAFLYLANWNTRRLMIRLPKQLLDVETAQQSTRAGAARMCSMNASGSCGLSTGRKSICFNASSAWAFESWGRSCMPGPSEIFLGADQPARISGDGQRAGNGRMSGLDRDLPAPMGSRSTSGSRPSR